MNLFGPVAALAMADVKYVVRTVIVLCMYIINNDGINNDG